MKLLVLGLMTVITLGCGSTGGGTPPPPGDDDDTVDANNPPPVETCLGGNNCVCPGDNACNHTCSTGAPECHVQGNTGPVDVTCDHNAECHVECNVASSCEVDCGGSGDCHVTCPETGCTVTNCVGPDCVVSCGSTGEATLNGTTATCP
jgi:hypothetical protein